MADILYLRRLDPPATPAAVLEAGQRAGGCFELHKVDWTHSFLSADGGRILCWYRAPDAESARLALRELGSDMSAVWPVRLIGGVEPRDITVSEVDVLAELALREAATSDEELLARLRRVLPAHAELAFGFLFNRRDRMVCLLRGADAEAIRSAFEDGAFPAAHAWPCTVVTPPRSQRSSNSL